MIPLAISSFVARKSTRIGFTALGWGMAGLLAANTYIDLRFEGPFGTSIGYEGWKPYGKRMEAERDAAKAAQEAQTREYRQASADAHERAVQARMAEQRRLSDLARNADNALEQARRDALADAREFIRANRVPAPGRIRSSGSTPTSDNSDSAIALPTDPAAIVDAAEYVIVPAADVLICTTNTVALESAQAWAAQLNEPAP